MRKFNACKYSMAVSNFHYFKRRTIVALMKRGFDYKEAVKMIENSSFADEMRNPRMSDLYVHETGLKEWLQYVIEDNGGVSVPAVPRRWRSMATC